MVDSSRASTHRCDVVQVHLETHPNADTLSIVRIWGYVVVVRTADWAEGQLAAYVVPDSIVDPSRPEFSSLRGHERIRVKRLRGIVSQGLLVPAPSGAREGDDVAEQLGIRRWEPLIAPESTPQAGSAPPGIYPVYAVESWHRYRHLLEAGEGVVVTEKIHGANIRAVWRDGRIWVGSRTEWKRPDCDGCLHLDAVQRAPWVHAWCREHEGYALYGEVYGRVSELRYGLGDEREIRAFDVLDPSGQWVDVGVFWRMVPEDHRVPYLCSGDYSAALLAEMAEGPSRVPGADHVREGCVIRPAHERTDPEIGRVILKLVGNGYHERGS